MNVDGRRRSGEVDGPLDRAALRSGHRVHNLRADGFFHHVRAHAEGGTLGKSTGLSGRNENRIEELFGCHAPNACVRVIGCVAAVETVGIDER